uniref:Uncharacterized protein n=1 Tax=Anguilla anguilla TaxID=7936 RepID=A0A0E9UFC4_ANGAN
MLTLTSGVSLGSVQRHGHVHVPEFTFVQNERFQVVVCRIHFNGKAKTIAVL